MVILIPTRLGYLSRDIYWQRYPTFFKLCLLLKTWGKCILVACQSNKQSIYLQIMLWCYIYGVIPKHRVLADILKGCVFHSGLGFWDMVITSRGKAKKGKEGKPETQGEWKMSLSPEIYRDLKKSHVVEDGHHFTIKPLIFFWLDIGQSMQISISRYSDLVSWWTKNSRKMTLNP